MSKEWFPKLSLRKNDTTTFPAEGTSEIHPLPLYDSSWEWWQMALCVIYPVPGLLHSKGKDGHLVHVWNANLGTLLPPWAWVTGYARTPENRYNQMQLASDCCSMWKDIFQFLPKKNRGGGGSNPHRKRRDGNTSDALTFRGPGFLVMVAGRGGAESAQRQMMASEGL